MMVGYLDDIAIDMLAQCKVTYFIANEITSNILTVDRVDKEE